MFQLIDLLPNLELKKAPNETWYYLRIARNLDSFIAKGLVKDKKKYIDSYLKRLEYKDPKITENIIKDFDSNQHLKGFRNYAQERVDRQTLQKMN